MNKNNKWALDTGSNTTYSRASIRKTAKQIHALMINEQMNKRIREEAYTTMISRIRCSPS